MPAGSESSKEVQRKVELVVTNLATAKTELEGFAAFLHQGMTTEVLWVLSAFAVLQDQSVIAQVFAPDLGAHLLQDLLLDFLAALQSDWGHLVVSQDEQLRLHRLVRIVAVMGTSGHGLQLLEALQFYTMLTLDISGCTLLPNVITAKKLDALVSFLDTSKQRGEASVSCWWLDLGTLLFKALEKHTAGPIIEQERIADDAGQDLRLEDPDILNCPFAGA
eukprot:TRINITY_DN61645_c0_g1_i1.p1 TRINITY_DN61645_c0_g1~~TRINITY_DN61645_c0_g1_i1.p1  ORF type:complete len:220 (-),score=43.89 TRINITY_DN61645_c0_g1_i1:78-737(-)